MFARSLLLPLVFLVSCSGGDPVPTEDTEPVAADGPRDTLVVGLLSDVKHLLPIVYETSADSQVIQAINMPMIDSQFDCSIKKQPGLVERWEWKNDGTVLWYKLREDITWSDGKPVTAHDVAFSYDLMRDPDVSSPRAQYVEKMVEGKSPVVLGDYELEFHFKYAYDRDTQVAHATFGAHPKHLLEGADRKTLRGHALNKAPVGNGPWKIGSYEPNNRLVLAANDAFTGPAEMKPKLNRVIFRVIPEYATRLLELQNGTIDFMQSINVADADLIREQHPEINLKRRGWRSMDYVAWNLSNPMFADVEVRKALALSVDIEGMMGKLLTSKTGEVFARQATSTITPALCNIHNDEVKPLPHNLETAKELLAKAGWTDTDGDGWVDKAGKPFEFTITTNNGNKRRKDAATLMQAQWKKVGVKANLELLEANAFFDNLRKRDYEAAVSGWSASMFVDPADAWHSDTPEIRREFNFTGYSNKRVDQLIERGLKTPLPNEAAPIWREMQQIIYDDQPYLFLWWMDEIVGVHSRFENAQVNVLSVLYHLHEWEVPPDRVKYNR